MDKQSLDTKLLSILYGLELQVKQPYYFQKDGLFWSMNRLFAHYSRIVSVYNPVTTGHGNKDFLDADLESYIVRHRVVLNSVAYMLWQLLELLAINIKIKPKGNSHPMNKEMSIFDLFKVLEKHGNTNTCGIYDVLKVGMKEFSFMRDQRDNIVHYKSWVMIFGDGPDFEFAIMNPAGTMPKVDDGKQTKLALKNVFRFTNDQHVFLWDWLNNDLADTIVDLCRTKGLEIHSKAFAVQLRGGSAIETFRTINNV